MEIATIHDLQTDEIKNSIIEFERLLKDIDRQLESFKVRKYVAQVSINALKMKLDELT